MEYLPVNRYIDHAVLKPELTESEAIQAIRLGIEYKVRTVCVRPCDVELAASLCKGTGTEVCTVVGFPHGTTAGEIKAQEARFCIEKGAKEIDMVVNYGRIKSGQWDLVEKDIQSVADVVKPAGALLKVIFETSVLNPDEIGKATEACIRAGADFTKTSTGFYGAGATEEAVAAMLKAADGRIRVKASGGIRDYDTAMKFIKMGCERLGIGYSSVPEVIGPGKHR